MEQFGTRCCLSRAGALFVGLAFASVAGGCVSYETQSGDTSIEILDETARKRSLVVDPLAGSALTLRVTESWQREQRETTAQSGAFEVESLLASFTEEPEMLVLSPLWLAIDVVTLVISGPIALIESATSGDSVYDRTKNMTVPVAGEAAVASSGTWSESVTTDDFGAATVDLREPAAKALCAGTELTYRIAMSGVEPTQGKLSMGETLSCADLPPSTEPKDRHAYWLRLLADCNAAATRDLLAKRVERADPQTLLRYRTAQSLPAAMSLLHVDYCRTYYEQVARGRANEDFATSSEAFGAIATLVREHDAALAATLQKQSVSEAARYVVHYYENRSLRSTPSFLVNYCNHHLAQAERCRDARSAAIFSAVLAARAGDVRKLVHPERAKSDRTVADLHQRATKEVRRQAAQAAYAAEVARIRREEEAWHYRYLNGRGGRSYGSVGSSGGRSSTQVGVRNTGPSIAERSRAHQAWLQTQKHNAANRNRAFDQFDRGN